MARHMSMEYLVDSTIMRNIYYYNDEDFSKVFRENCANSQKLSNCEV